MTKRKWRDFQNIIEFKHFFPHCKKALAIQSNHPNALNNLGLAFKQLGETKIAKDYYEKALSLEPNNEKFNSNYGELLLSLDQHEKGLNHIKKGSGFINFSQNSFEII